MRQVTQAILFMIGMIVCIGCMVVLGICAYGLYAGGDIAGAVCIGPGALFCLFCAAFMVRVEAYHRKMFGWWPYNR